MRLRELPGRLQRRLSSLRYSLSAPTPGRVRPSTTASIIFALTFVVFVLAGGIYDILEHPIPLITTSTGISVLVKGTLGQQTLNESLIAAFLYALGLGGLYMLLKSTRFAYRPRNAYLLLILGTLTVLIVVFYSNSLMTSKIGG